MTERHLFDRELLLIALAASALLAQPTGEAMFTRTLNFPALLRGGWIEAHWMEDGNRFWFAEAARGDAIIFKYNPVAKTKTPLFDVSRIRGALRAAVGHKLSGTGLPFEVFSFLPGEESVRFRFEDHDFTLSMNSYAIRAAAESDRDYRQPQLLSQAAIVGPPPVYESLSPDGRWFLGVKEGNLYLRSPIDGHREALTSDGAEGYNWNYGWDSAPVWSPDSETVAARKIDHRNRRVPVYPIMHWLKPMAEVEWIPVGGDGASAEHYIIDIRSKALIRVAGTGGFPRGWRPDSSELLITRTAVQKIELLAASRKTGATRLVFTETTKTFFDVALSLPNSPTLSLLADNRRFLWLSERTGWNNIYLYDLNGTVIRNLTADQRPVERIVAVDEANGWVYYTAHGGEERPYDFHLYRVNLSGGQPKRLTDAPGQHDQSVYASYQGAAGEGIQFAPSRQFFLDGHSDISRPPQTDLRRADGSLVETLAKANADDVRTLMPNPPEEFVVKAADGQTDLYGVLYKPFDFQAEKMYPVLDFIYAGPQMTRVPRKFGDCAREQGFAHLGFIVFVVDGRGTPDRGKAFQDVAYKNIGREEIPDHVAALKQLAAKRSWMDVSRVGIFGGSFGGYFAERAMLQAPDVYRVGVAVDPLSDLRKEGGAGDLSRWMGNPDENKEAYDFASNLRIASNLNGHLLIVHGTSDLNAPFAATMRMADALEQAGKYFDLVVLPEHDHRGQTSGYSLQALKHYLVENLRP